MSNGFYMQMEGRITVYKHTCLILQKSLDTIKDSCLIVLDMLHAWYWLITTRNAKGEYWSAFMGGSVCIFLCKKNSRLTSTKILFTYLKMFLYITLTISVLGNNWLKVAILINWFIFSSLIASQCTWQPSLEHT